MQIYFQKTGPYAGKFLSSDQESIISDGLDKIPSEGEGSIFFTYIAFSDSNYTLTFSQCAEDGSIVSSRKKRFQDTPFTVETFMQFAFRCLGGQ
ncbi:hypothetical protein FDP22_24145 (plasmid) [Paroceanicella profunda]|uniref:Uncharacterized protein n=1 Tax=Paroceanicella profunda TaxID=2579971 RepID=A0A5B8G4E4_9RHOB|nr:hypothetical protein [Paroceanicella profunda]QDL94954.1 hypothetical protein FDP22_24145 [Paroceanicella profunda]